MSESSELPENGQEKTHPDARQQPRREPMRVIHGPKTATHSRGANRKHASLFHHRPFSSPQGKDQPGSVGNSTDGEGLASPGATKGLSGNNPSRNPGQRLRTLENAGKEALLDQIPGPPGKIPSESATTQISKPPLQSRFSPMHQSAHRTYWDVSSAFSLIVNLILLVVVFVMAAKINSLTISVNKLLGGMFNDFIRMDNSVLSTTINMPNVPVPLNFNLPVVQQETDVTLTRSVTIKSAHVTITSGALSINNAPATVTLPQGTILPVAFQIDVPVQTTVLMNLQVPVTIKLADANSADPNVANLHTAILGLQDDIGPLYCQINPQARDYLNDPLCNVRGGYITRSAPPNP